MKNDPVNFVDPLGLNPGGVLGGAIANLLNIGPGTVTVNVPIGGSNEFEIETGPSEPGPFGPVGGPNPGPDPEPGPQDPQREKDCYEFADLVATLANSIPSQTNVEFRDLLMERFSEPSAEFGSDGFKLEFQDHSGSRNQARHYVGGLFAGHLGAHFGTDVGSAAANLIRETTITVTPTSIGGAIIPFPIIVPPNDSQRADRALNVVAGRHGAALHARRIGPRDLADLIRKEVCAPR